MDLDVGGRRGCLAAVSLPLAAMARPFRAIARRIARPARDQRPTVSWSRHALGGVVRLGFEIEAPIPQAAEVAGQVAALVAEAAAGIGLTVGSVGVVPGEEPLLVAFAPKRDIVAPRVRDSLAGDLEHRWRRLWLALPSGTYLASVVDPYRPFGGDEGEVAALVGSGKAPCALTSEWTRSSKRYHISLGVYSPRPELRKLLSLARRGADGAPDLPPTR